MHKALLISLVALWIYGCAAESRKPTLAVQHTVLRYTQLLLVGYAQMNVTPLQEVATERQAMRVFNHMAALGSAGIRMESELVDIEFLNIGFPEKSVAKATTRETWNYTHMNTDTEMPNGRPVTGLIYTLSYELMRKNGRWLVSSVSTLKEHNAPAGSDWKTLY
jgi:hypothetical protein